MLLRNLSRDAASENRRVWRLVLAGSAAALALSGLYELLPEPGPRVRPVAVADQELLRLAATLTAPLPEPSDAAEKARAALGRALFLDAGLSHDGAVACATCHVPSRAYTGGTTTARPASAQDGASVVDTRFARWLGRDGRSDSLEGEALRALEDPRRVAGSRLGIARSLATTHRAAYERAFGKLPATLLAPDLPPQALPLPPAPSLPVEVATHALATLGPYTLLSDLLQSAQASRLAPAMELSRRVFVETPVDSTWGIAWERLPADVRRDATEAFGNAGRALAAYMRGLVALEAPFDRFVRRVKEKPGRSVAAAFDASFGELQWTGFKLFAGPADCITCHNGPRLSDDDFHNLGLTQRPDDPTLAIGRAAGAVRAATSAFSCARLGLCQPGDAAVDPNDLAQVGAYRTAPLRGVAETGPWLRDGRATSLDEALDHTAWPGGRPAAGHRSELVTTPLDLTDEERAALVAFLEALTSPVRDLNTDDVARR